MCIRGKRKVLCIEARGCSVMCKHGKEKVRYLEGFGGSNMCMHGNQEARCLEGFGGSSMCIHGKRDRGIASRGVTDLRCASIKRFKCFNGKGKYRCTKGCAAGKLAK
jgi:hypothetical protein